jgi:hypothetical protein
MTRMVALVEAVEVFLTEDTRVLVSVIHHGSTFFPSTVSYTFTVSSDLNLSTCDTV